jgi:kynurenine formamidase
MDLDDVLSYLRGCEWTDLTHAFEPGIPHYAPFPDEQRSVLFGFKPGEGTLGSGFLVHEYRHVGQWGTHVDPPAHFIEGGRTVDALPVEEMVLPLVVLDVREQVNADPEFAATAATIRSHEAEFGQIPDRAFVALLTGWGVRWPDAKAMDNRDAQGISRAPGWDVSALRLLFEQRGTVAIGHDVTSTDSAALVDRGHVEAEMYVLSHDRWQIELMANLDRVPVRGALIIATWPKPMAGSGFPARCFAIAPRSTD